MKTISNISFTDKHVLIRVDFNVPLDDNFKILDDSRMLAALPTIKKVVADNGKVIIMSHLGRPSGSYEKKWSLKHLVKHLSFLLKKDIIFCADCVGEKAVSVVKKMKPTEIVLLENLRFYKEETLGDFSFAKKLSKLGDIYINDAFGTAHRNHASTSVIAQFFPDDKFFGLLLEKEIETLDLVLKNQHKPFTAIIGGAKITGKIDVIKALINKVDNLIIGGGMSYTFAKSMGYSIGNSIVENKKLSLAKELIKLAKKKGVNLILPVDSLNAHSFDNNSNTLTTSIKSIPNGLIGLDIGEKSISLFCEIISKSKTIIWNGPMGVFEMSNFENGTKEVSIAISNATKKGALSLVGGGDSISAIKQFNLEADFSYISTGGGAMLEYIEGKGLPGITSISA
tara:strand:- start:2416 stop:3606 length:1191 start_codon:yes stop_codon:yes gene_type:complete